MKRKALLVDGNRKISQRAHSKLPPIKSRKRRQPVDFQESAQLIFVFRGFRKNQRLWGRIQKVDHRKFDTVSGTIGISQRVTQNGFCFVAFRTFMHGVRVYNAFSWCVCFFFSAPFLFSSSSFLSSSSGLALFYGGLVKRSSAVTMMMQTLIALGVVAVIWFLFGFSLIFGPDHGGVIGGRRVSHVTCTCSFTAFFLSLCRFLVRLPHQPHRQGPRKC